MMLINAKRRPSGIDQLEQISWGTHFCLFYETREDLLDILVPYCKAGLQSDEFCLCITSEPIAAAHVELALHNAMPEFESYVTRGQIEIISHKAWYLKEGHFDPLQARQGWLNKLDRALAKGYAGMRFIADISWLEKQDWDRFAEYEGTLDAVFLHSQMLGICAYSFERCLAADVLDVVRHHQFTLARWNGIWETLGGSELKRAHMEVQELNTSLEHLVWERTAALAAANEQLKKEVLEHKQNEAAFLLSETRLQAAIDAAEIGLWEWDLTSGEIIWLGHHDKLFGFAPGEFDGTYASFEKRVHPEDLEELNRVVRRAREEKLEYAHEYRVIWPDGGIHWIAGRGRFVYSETGQPVRMYGAVLDITERMQAETVLRQAHENYVTFVNSIDGIVWQADAQTLAFRFVSHQAERILGYPVERWLAEPSFWSDHLHPGDREWAVNFCVSQIQETLPHTFEYRMLAADGRVVWLRDIVTVTSEHGNPIRVQGIMVDITERKRAEEALRISEQKLNEAQRIAQVGYWEHDLDSGIIWSDEVYRIFGISPEEEPFLTLARVQEFIHPEDQKNMLQTIDQALQGGPRYNIEYRVIRPDGEVRIVHSRGDVILDNAGKPQSLFGVVQDITERKRAEEELKKFELIFSHTPDGIALLDKEYRYQSVNIAYEKFSNLKREQLIGRIVPEYLGEQVFQQYVKPNFDRCLNGEIINYQEWFHYPTLGKRFVDVTYFPFIDVHGQIAGVVAMSRDITDRKQSEEALEISETRLQAAIDAANIGLWDWELDSGDLVGLGHHDQLLGFAPGEFDGAYASFEKRVHPDDLEELNNAIRRARDEKSEYTHEYRVVWPDGSIHWIAGLGKFVYNETGQPARMYGALLDITERKQAEEAVKESEEQLRLAFEAAKFGTGEMDLKTNQIACSDAMQQVLGFAPGTFNPTFQEYVERVHPEDRDIVRQAVENGIAGQPDISVDYRIVWPDRSIHWVTSRAKVFYDQTGEATRIIGALMDITGLKQVEEALRQSERKLAEAQRIAHVGYWERDLDSDLIAWSDEVYRIYGISPEEEPVLTVARVRELIHPDDQKKVFQLVTQPPPEGPRHHTEYRVIRPDGEVRIVQGNILQSYDESGRARRFFGVVQDITERRHAEELIRQQSARSQLLADISRALAEAGLNYQSVLDMVAKRTAELVGDLCVILSYSQDGKHNTPNVAYHSNPRALELIQNSFRQDWHANSQQLRKLLASEVIYMPVVKPEEYRPTLDPALWPYFDEIGISGLIYVPLHVNGQVMGAIGVMRDRSNRPYTPEDQACLRDIADRAALTMQNARLFEQVQASQERLRVLSQRLVDVQESEQKRLAREIHDDISQALAVLVLQLGSARNTLPKSARNAEAILARSEELTEETLEHARSIIAGLRPQVLDDLGLIPAVRHLANELHANTGTTVKVKTSRLPKRLPPPIEVTLFRIVQEALANVRKHAQAHHVTISLEKEPERVVLAVQDDGVGFEMHANRFHKTGDMLINGGLVIPAGHFGLIGIQEQVTSIGGTFQIRSAPAQGTSIQVELPL